MRIPVHILIIGSSIKQFYFRCVWLVSKRPKASRFFLKFFQGIYGQNRSEMNCEKKPTENPTLPCFTEPAAVLMLLSISQYHVGFDLIVLNIFFVVLRILCFFVLKWRSRSLTWAQPTPPGNRENARTFRKLPFYLSPTSSCVIPRSSASSTPSPPKWARLHFVPFAPSNPGGTFDP